MHHKCLLLDRYNNTEAFGNTTLGICQSTSASDTHSLVMTVTLGMIPEALLCDWQAKQAQKASPQNHTMHMTFHYNLQCCAHRNWNMHF